MNRKPGFYWVKYGDWQTAEYSGCYWYLIGVETALVCEELEDIGSRIERPADPERIWYEYGAKK